MQAQHRQLKSHLKEHTVNRLTNLLTKIGILKNDVNYHSKVATVQKVDNPATQAWILYEGDFRDNKSKTPNCSVDLIYSDLPFGVDLSKMSKHNTGTISYHDTRDSLLGQLKEIATEAFRILRQDRYCVFFFGFNYYSELLRVLAGAGFTVNPVPIVW